MRVVYHASLYGKLIDPKKQDAIWQGQIASCFFGIFAEKMFIP
jgi:hypothetical protein